MPDDVVVVSVRVTPRGGRDAVIGVRDGVLHVRVSAPPVDGAANQAVLAVVAKAFGLRRSQASLVGGATARDKRIALSGLAADAARDRLAALPVIK